MCAVFLLKSGSRTTQVVLLITSFSQLFSYFHWAILLPSINNFDQMYGKESVRVPLVCKTKEDHHFIATDTMNSNVTCSFVQFFIEVGHVVLHKLCCLLPHFHNYFHIFTGLFILPSINQSSITLH